MITKKKYYCPNCGRDYEIETNHFGEIYSGCDTCGSRVLYCKEPEGIRLLNTKDQLLVSLWFYRFDISKPDQEMEYNNMVSMLQAAGLSVWETYVRKTGEFSKIKLMKKRVNGGLVILYEPTKWENQFISSVGRIHTWEELVFPNPRIKEGYTIHMKA